MAFDILIVDDEQDIRELVSGILSDEGYITRTASCCVEAMKSIKESQPHLIILDVWLGEAEIDGLRLLNMIKTDNEFIPIIMMSGHGTIETAVNSIKQGAYDFIEKPFDSNRLILSVKKAVEMSSLKRENEELKAKAKIDDAIIGISQKTNILRNEIKRISKLGKTCFIHGPVGSDKEGIAREIHRQSEVSELSFIVINCQIYNQNQLEIDLFGLEVNDNEKQKIKIGALERVKGGTIYLNEVTLLSHDLQKKLKKAIKNKEYMRVGGGAPVPNRARIISGSSLDVDVLVKNELFEGDLYRALSFNAVNVTALSKRQEDIPLLVNHFIKQSAIAYNIPEKKFNNEAMSVLISYYWPGDVMQLRNLIDWVLVMSNSMASSNDNDDDDNSGGMLGAETLPKEITDGKTPGGTCDVKFISSLTNLSIKDAREAFEREYLREQLRKFSGNVSQTSKFVGMERSALHRKLKFLNISDIEGTDNIETEKIEDGEIR